MPKTNLARSCRRWMPVNVPPFIWPRRFNVPCLWTNALDARRRLSRGLTVIGSAGLLLAAKNRGLIPAVAPILDQWRQLGYFLSASVVKAVLERAGETG